MFGGRVLLAEDNAVDSEIAIEYLTELGFSAVIVGNDRAAVAAFADEQFDLILMDCQMPKMDGFEATRQIRKIERVFSRFRTPIIALAANASE